ncbi:YbgC/FadM family acyl-CoA thioesterase [Paracoccus kondratievae]|uniref:4-hydroxybenzoyl-CoA thioesterase n=1 Tax=Paracoccus kondratievae TaxID=135740 RepID=A0AAD3NZR9_9RHOB|nr:MULTISPECIES: YbgC/FadM family acyl-CoA thioesterase [Paracoccus]QFQ87633.1 YbgC/FadM family acyl-CoA thioesterase [Paracoccus kondratievae]GLK64932.1 4-hydroxybenzoyl-CoA thioesterase [Paracoccus kondratievae]SMG24527.1 acyl-CoA thioester hydrolase [Paracoccus sp. J56]
MPSTSPVQAENVFVQTYRVYYAETDAGGIVYHSKYMEFAERSRSELLRHVGYPLVSAEGGQFVARNASISWQRPARLDDLIRCESSVIAIRGASLRIRHAFYRDKEMLVQIEIELAHINAQMRAARIPAALIEKLSPYLADSPL